MTKTPVNILLIVIMTFFSSCFKNWNCTCSHYVQYSDTNGTVTTLRTDRSTIAGTKRGAQKDCAHAEQIGKEDATMMGADPGKVNCTFN